MIRKEIRLRIIYGQPTAAYRRIADIVTGPVIGVDRVVPFSPATTTSNKHMLTPPRIKFHGTREVELSLERAVPCENIVKT